MATEQYNLRELEKLIKEGKRYKLFKPFVHNGQILINVEKILTVNDIYKLDGKSFGQLEVVQTAENDTNEKLVKAIIDNAIKLLKTSKLFYVDETHHLDLSKRKECEKLLTGIIGNSPLLAQLLYRIYSHSKKLFLHSLRVGIIASIVDLGIQEKLKHHDGLRSEILLTGALLHDVGFLDLPLTYVDKYRHSYDENEREEYKKHPQFGDKILNSLNGAFRKKVNLIVQQHEERLLGNGFPNGLKGSEIDELALIVGLADEFDLLTSQEIIASQKSESEAMSRISRSGKLFGSQIIDSFYTWFRYLK